MFKANIINLPWTNPIYKEYLNHTLGLTLSTPGLVFFKFEEHLKQRDVIDFYVLTTFLNIPYLKIYLLYVRHLRFKQGLSREDRETNQEEVYFS